MNDFEEDIKLRFKEETPEDIGLKCLSLYQTYLGGNWTKLNAHDIEIKRLSGGMSNQVYYCGIPKRMRVDGEGVPQEVAVRLYGFKFDLKTFDVDSPRMSDAIVWLMASENGLEPKVYGLFPEGQIQKFYKTEEFTVDSLQDKCILDQLAVKLAEFQAMEPPLAKNRNWGKTFLDSYAPKAQQFIEDNKHMFEEYGCQSLIDCDLIVVKDWVLDIIERADSLIVFTVMDFRFANFLISKEREVVLNDFEFADYYYRGLDFAALFLTFDRPEERGFAFKDESVVRAFISRYIEENEKIFGKQFTDNDINSVDHILSQTKALTLFWGLMYAITMVLNDEVLKLPIEIKTSMTLANGMMSKILATKGVIPPEVKNLYF